MLSRTLTRCHPLLVLCGKRLIHHGPPTDQILVKDAITSRPPLCFPKKNFVNWVIIDGGVCQGQWALSVKSTQAAVQKRLTSAHSYATKAKVKLVLGKGQRWQFFIFWHFLGTTVSSSFFGYCSWSGPPSLCVFVMALKYLDPLESYSTMQSYVLTNKDNSKWCRKKFEVIILGFVKFLIQVWTSVSLECELVASFCIHLQTAHYLWKLQRLSWGSLSSLFCICRKLYDHSQGGSRWVAVITFKNLSISQTHLKQVKSTTVWCWMLLTSPTSWLMSVLTQQQDELGYWGKQPYSQWCQLKICSNEIKQSQSAHSEGDGSLHKQQWRKKDWKKTICYRCVTFPLLYWADKLMENMHAIRLLV